MTSAKHVQTGSLDEMEATADDSSVHVATAPLLMEDREELKLKRKRGELEFVKSGVEVYTELSTNDKLDQRGMVVFKDAVLAIYIKTLLEIEDVKLQQTKERLHTELEHAKAILEIENQKKKAENAMAGPEHAKDRLVQESNNCDIFAEKIRAMDEEKTRIVNDLMAKIAEKSAALEEANAMIREQADELTTKRLKKTGFTISSVINDMNLKISTKEKFCKRLVAKLKRRYPECRLFKQNDVVHFFNEDKKLIEELVREEFFLWQQASA